MNLRQHVVMPSSQRPKYDWPIRLSCTVVGKKPLLRSVPGLEIVVGGRFPTGQRYWRCCIDGLFAN
jgi:hypothetical protein